MKLYLVGESSFIYGVFSTFDKGMEVVSRITKHLGNQYGEGWYFYTKREDGTLKRVDADHADIHMVNFIYFESNYYVTTLELDKEYQIMDSKFTIRGVVYGQYTILECNCETQFTANADGSAGATVCNHEGSQKFVALCPSCNQCNCQQCEDELKKQRLLVL